MRLFKCQACGNLLYFENRTCGQCGHRLAYLPHLGTLSAMEPDADGGWTALAKPDRARRFCANAAYDACNWLAPANNTEPMCLACRHNSIVPDLTQPANLAAWQQIEIAKHRLFYSLLRWGLPLKTAAEDHEHGLSFEFLADPPSPGGAKIVTGHDSGKITIALAEANDAERERRRQAMGEPYRTLLGHFRHEVAHHYWDVLVRDGGELDACRALFGDDTADYAEALQRHYANGAPADWQEHFVTGYAASHPWEDFAETWAHYVHIVDTLEMVAASGMSVRLSLDEAAANRRARVDFDPYAARDIEQIIDTWLPFVFAINSVCRAMGQPDLYPFVLAPAVIEKLGFIHRLVRGGKRKSDQAAGQQ
jgi:hypothetical protein